MVSPSDEGPACDFCGLPLAAHAWNRCLKGGKSRKFPWIPEYEPERSTMQEELKNLVLSPGGVYRFQKLDNGRHGFIGGPEIVEVDEATAARCRPTGSVYYIDEQHVAEFKDQLTYELYGQPLDQDQA